MRPLDRRDLFPLLFGGIWSAVGLLNRAIFASLTAGRVMPPWTILLPGVFLVAGLPIFAVGLVRRKRDWEIVRTGKVTEAEVVSTTERMIRVNRKYAIDVEV
jgi:hypothetical protein